MTNKVLRSVLLRVSRLAAQVGLLCLGAAAGTALAQQSPPEAARRTITVVMDDNYPPFTFRDSNGQLKGILKDTWALWEQRTGIAVDLQAMDWAKAQEQIQAGRADVIDTIFNTEPRRKVYDFTAPYAKLDVPIFFHESVSGIVNAESLKGFTVGVKEGDACIDVLRARGVDSLKIYPSYATIIAAASAGDVRVFCVDEPPARYLLHELGVEAQFRRSVPLYSGEFHRAVHKGNTALLKTIEDGFARITEAERRAIEEKWYGSAIDSRFALPYARYGGYFALGVVLLGLTLTGWSIALRRRVAARTAQLSRSLGELQAAKQSTEQTLAQLDATLAAIPDLLFEVDIEGRYLDYRAAQTELLLVPPEQLLGRTVHDLMPAEAAQVVAEALREASAKGRAHGAQLRLDLPQGEHWFELSIACKRARTRAEVDRFVVLSRDITDRKRAETALQQGEESFRHFFEAGLVGMAITVPDKHWGRFNRRLAEMLGYTQAEMENLTWAEVTHPDDLAADERHFKRVLSGETDGYTMDKRFIRKDGQVMHAAIAVRCERNALGQAERFFAIVEDITQRKAAELELARHRDELELLVQERSRELVAAHDVAVAASRAKSEFLSSMSHELRTPLNAIMGFSQLLEIDGELSASSRRFAMEIKNAGKHLLELINDVLDLAQVESGRLLLTPQPLPLAELGRTVTTLLQPLADQRGVTLLPLALGDLTVLADRTRLMQVLVNLVSNAIKYNRSGGSVSLQAIAQDGSRLRISVRDTGAGIPPERLSLLFEPFSRLGAEKGSIEGTGIGLSICRRLVELMGGSIGVDSVPGEGSVFWIDLPQARPAASDHAASQAAAAAGMAPQLPRARVLYVEDNTVNLVLMEHLIARHAGLQLLSATTAAQGLEVARSKEPDLILLDINLPDMDGHAVLAALRADLRTRAIPVVAVTANAMPGDEPRARDAGFDDYIAKPIVLAGFDAMLSRMLGQDPPGTVGRRHA